MLNRRSFATTFSAASGGLLFGCAWPETSAAANFRHGVHHTPTATNVIFLFMSGGPSQVDTFDPKPELNRLGGKDVPRSLAELVPKIQRAGLRNILPSPWAFSRHGQSGIPVSSLFPATASHVDDLCVIRSMTHRNPVHGPAECVALTGSGVGERPSVGAWAMYGLGSATDDLPGFVAMNLHTDGMQYPQAAGWGTAFLPSRHQATLVNPMSGIENAKMPDGTGLGQRRAELAAIEVLNRRYYESVRTSELEARLQSYSIAHRMQAAAPELFNIAQESKETQRLYGMETPESEQVGRACLLARRMIERGVRVAQVRVGGWDAHGNIRANHERMAKRTDVPIAGLIQDLKRRGLLDTTLVVWGGEFGRTPTMEGRAGGRDHSPTAYSAWLAGGGVRGGTTVGETDAIGYTVTHTPVSPFDLHATILHALGIDSTRLTFDHHGLVETPLGVNGGSVVDVFS